MRPSRVITVDMNVDEDLARQEIAVKVGQGAKLSERSGSAPKRMSALRLLALILVYGTPAFWTIKTFKILDPDVWWHLATGRWILQHHALPATDPFSIYGSDKPWLVYSWGFDLIIQGLYSQFGLVGIVFYEVIVRVLVAVALFHFVSSLLPKFWHAVAITSVALYILSHVLTPRPGMITVLLGIVVLDRLLSFRKTGDTKKLWLLPPLFILWANWHIQFVYGLLILGVFAIEPFLNILFMKEPFVPNAISIKRIWPVLFLCAAATLINPYGPRIYSTVFLYMNQPKSFAAITELMAMSFRQPQHYAALLFALCAAMAIGWRREPRLLWPLLLGLAGVLAFRSVKEIWLLGVVSAGAIADGWTDSIPPAQRGFAWRERMLVTVGVVAMLAVGARYYDLANSWLEMQVAGNFPEVACQYIEKNHLQGPLYNDFNWGGFVIWRLPGTRVVMDGRTNVHGDERVGRSLAVWSGKSDWAEDPELKQANVILAKKTSVLASLLRLDARHKIVFEDQQAVIFQPK